MTHDSLHTIVDESSTRLFQVYDGTDTAYVWGMTSRDAEHTCYVHDYLDDDGYEDWEVAEVLTSHRDYAERRAEADRRRDALHGR